VELTRFYISCLYVKLCILCNDFIVAFSEVAETVTSAVADNIHYAADNLSSVVASAYSVFRQKTVEMQVNLKNSYC
jgi:cell shape-determining protein MreC